MRFTPEDLTLGGFVTSSELSPGSGWLRLAMLDGKHFVNIETVPIRADELLSRMEAMAAAMIEQTKLCSAIPLPFPSLATHLPFGKPQP